MAATSLLAVAMLAASLWIAMQNASALLANQGLVEHARLARAAAQTLLTTLREAEAGQRGYLLTGDPIYLQPFEAGRERLDADIATLDVAALDDAARVEHVEHMRSLARSKMAEMAATVAQRQAGETAAALEVVRGNRGKPLMDAFRAEVQFLQGDVEVRLAGAGAGWRWLAIDGLAALAAVLLGGVALLQRRAWRRAAGHLPQLDRFTKAFDRTQGMLRGNDGRISFWSSGAAQLYGYQPQEAIGRISHQLLRTEFPIPRPDIEAQLEAAEQWRGELVQFHKDGSRMAIATHWALHRGRVDGPDTVIEVNYDITDLKRAEAECRETALHLRLALDASDQATWRWEAAQGTHRLEWDDRCKALFGLPPESDMTLERWAAGLAPEERVGARAEVARALDPANPDDDYEREYRIVRPDGAVRWIATSGRAVFEAAPDASAGRRVVRIQGTMRDVTAVRWNEAERRRTAALLRTIVETSPALIYAKDRRGGLLLANQPVLTVIGKPWPEIEGRTHAEYMGDSPTAQAIMENDRRIMESGESEQIEEAADAGGTTRTWASTKAPLRDEAGEIVGLVGVSIEITERKRAERRQHLLIDELNHRVKNTLATVQAIALQTLRGVDPDVQTTLQSRLMALAAAHDVLTRELWEGAALDDIVDGALAPFGGRKSGRFQVAGPALHLRPRSALALSMGLHELATNAVKYGALSTAHGMVTICWAAAADSFVLTWTECGGPPVAKPARCGFGTRLIERVLAQDLGGLARLDFSDPSGVTCRVEAPLHETAAAAAAAILPMVGRRPEPRA